MVDGRSPDYRRPRASQRTVCQGRLTRLVLVWIDAREAGAYDTAEPVTRSAASCVDLGVEHLSHHCGPVQSRFIYAC